MTDDLRLLSGKALNEAVCEDCMAGDRPVDGDLSGHEVCRRGGGYLYDDTPEQCPCHLTGHRLDNR